VAVAVATEEGVAMGVGDGVLEVATDRSGRASASFPHPLMSASAATVAAVRVLMPDDGSADVVRVR
jgi:hypothetical protein